MKDVLKTFEGRDLKMPEEGKVLLEDSNDVKYLIKLINYYYKKGMVSGKFYGSNAGNIVEVKL